MSGLLNNIVQAAKDAIDGVNMEADDQVMKVLEVKEIDAGEDQVKAIDEVMIPETVDDTTEETKMYHVAETTEEVNEDAKEEVTEEVKQEITEEVSGDITEEANEDITDEGKTEIMLDQVDAFADDDLDNKRKADDSTDKPAKKSKSDPATSKEGPMGELRPTDILAGNYRKRVGNFLYKKLLREHAPDVGKVEMRNIVAKVVDAIHAQDPPGRFIREGGDSILSRAQTNQKVARALREVHERSQKEGELKGEGVEGKPTVKKAGRASEKHEPMGELRPTDVLTGNYRKRPGNFLYKKLLRENAPSVGKEEMRAVVNRVIDGITGQNPPGRFIREGGGGLLTRGQTHQKVARALREVMERSTGDGKQAAEKAAKKAKAATETKDEPMGEIRPTDVLTGNYRKRPGNFLFKKLLRENAPFVGKEEMSIVVARVIDAITAQDPPGRFIREGGSSLLTKGQTRQKVARALREVVERTKNPDKDKNKPPAITAAEAIAADKARREAALLKVVEEQAEAAVNLLTEGVTQVPVKEDLPEDEPEKEPLDGDVAKDNPVPNEKELDQLVPIFEEIKKEADQEVPTQNESEQEEHGAEEATEEPVGEIAEEAEEKKDALPKEEGEEAEEVKDALPKEEEEDVEEVKDALPKEEEAEEAEEVIDALPKEEEEAEEMKDALPKEEEAEENSTQTRKASKRVEGPREPEKPAKRTRGKK